MLSSCTMSASATKHVLSWRLWSMAAPLSMAEVREVVTRVYTAPKAGLNRRHNRTAARKFECKTPAGDSMMGTVSRCSTGATAEIVSEERAKAGPSTVSQATIHRATNWPEFGMKVAVRGARQQGSKENTKTGFSRRASSRNN